MAAINWKKIILLLIAMLVGAGSVLLYLFVRDSFDLTLPSWPVSILSVIAALFISVFIHELGHFIAGLVQKFQFHMFAVGPFKLEKTDKGLRTGLNLNMNVAGGLTLMTPNSETYDKEKFAWFIAAGPIASILLFIILATIAFSVHALFGTDGNTNTIIYFSWLTAVISLAIGITSLFPEEQGGLETDGMQLRDLLRGGKRAVIKQYVMQLYISAFNGTRPRDYNTDILAKLNDATPKFKDNNSILARLFTYIHLLDKNEIKKAGDIINELTVNAEYSTNDLLNPSIFLEKSFFEAYYNGDTEKAELYFEKGRKGYSEKSTLKRTETILLLKKGEKDAAEKSAKKAIKAINNSYDKGGSIWEKEILEQALKESGIILSGS
ncbi:MAG: M50 family metallopeptidase [Balneolaceae bacterium]|nr:M50 family metallopeptidase [Balneolaceae bacterium]